MVFVLTFNPTKEVNTMIKIYTKHNCPQCDVTKQMLQNKKVDFEAIDIETDNNALDEIVKLGYKSLPVVLITDNENNCVTDHWSGFRPEKIFTLC